jgi:transcriptional regulator with XRE-family HTH domain
VRTLGDLLRKSRIERGLKLRELAALLGISCYRLSAWERDEVRPPWEEAMKFSELLRLPVAAMEPYANSGL